MSLKLIEKLKNNNTTILQQIQEVENKSGKSLLNLIGKVPYSNVITAFSNISTKDIIEMVNSVPLTKLVEGLCIITPKEIVNISTTKLKIVLKYGNMPTVKHINNTLNENTIINSISKMSEEKIIDLLEKDDKDLIVQTLKSFE